MGDRVTLWGGPLDGREQTATACSHGNYPALNLGTPVEQSGDGADAPRIYNFARYEYDKETECYRYVKTTRSSDTP